MDTNRLKKFAIEARNILKAGIAAKLTSLGPEGFKHDFLMVGENTRFTGTGIGEGSFHIIWPGDNDLTSCGNLHIRGKEQLHHLLGGCHFIPIG